MCLLLFSLLLFFTLFCFILLGVCFVFQCLCMLAYVFIDICVFVASVYVISVSVYLLYLSLFKSFFAPTNLVLIHWLAFFIWHHNALTRSFHMASFKYNDKLAKNVSLLLDQSKHLHDRITCVQCKLGDCCFISPIFVVDVVVVFFVCLFFILYLFSPFFSFSFFLTVSCFYTFYCRSQSVYRECLIFDSSEHVEPFHYKGLRQTGLISHLRDFKSSVGLWMSGQNFFGTFYWIIDCIVRHWHSVQRTW